MFRVTYRCFLIIFIVSFYGCCASGPSVSPETRGLLANMVELRERSVDAASRVKKDFQQDAQKLTETRRAYSNARASAQGILILVSLWIDSPDPTEEERIQLQIKSQELQRYSTDLADVAYSDLIQHSEEQLLSVPAAIVIVDLASRIYGEVLSYLRKTEAERRLLAREFRNEIESKYSWPTWEEIP